ncbi:helicase mov-10-B.1 [Achlya hypogyna]|uniref:RNA helicase n=1 Tax=Achlya hypogyna TaxID=1202772 RepID=A0A1V9ZLW0_ACHHY|nr:helicase mov-10-B.1 [Achlya hypogyna]
MDAATGKCLRKLSDYVRQHNGRVLQSQLPDFYAQTRATAKCERIVNSAGGIAAFVGLHGSSAPIPLTFTNDAIEFRDTIEAINALGDAVRRRGRTSTVVLLGTFRKAHPEYHFMWPNKPISSYEPFVEAHGHRGNGALVLSGAGPLRELTWTASLPTSRPAAEYVTTLARAKEVFKILAQAPTLMIDLEGDLTVNGRLSLMQITSTGNRVYVLDIYVCPSILTDPEIAAVLTSKLVVLHDARHDFRALDGQFGLRLSQLFDTQVAHQLLVGASTQVGLNVVLETYAGVVNTVKDDVQHRPGLWEQRPLPAKLLDYAGQDVEHLPAAFVAMKALMTPTKFAECLTKSLARLNKSTPAPQAQTPTPAAVPAAIAASLQRLAAFIEAQGGEILISSGLHEFYMQHPTAKASLKPTPTTKISAVIAQYGARISPGISVVDEKLRIGAQPAVTIATCLAHLVECLIQHKGKVEGGQLGQLYTQHRGLDDVIRSNGGKASAFVNTHGKFAKPAIAWRGGSLVFASEQSLPSAAQLLKEYGPKFVLNKYGVEISDDGAFAHPIETNANVTQVYKVFNRSTETMMLRRYFQVKTTKGKSPFRLGATVAANAPLPPRTQVEIPCTFTSANPGQYKAIFAFEFATPSGTKFMIGRVLDKVIAVDASMDAETRTAIAAATKRSRRKKRANLHFVRPDHNDVHSGAGTGGKRVVALKGYDIPKTLPQVDWSAPLALGNYKARFEHLLFVEELELVRQQKEFDIDGAHLVRKNARLYELEVPGLAEGRPSLMTGDKVWLSRGTRTFQGDVSQVRLDGIYISMPATFTSVFNDKATFNVRFIMSRVPLRHMHQGLATISAANHGALLFPPPYTPALPSATRVITMTRPINPEQARAIRDILHVATAPTPTKVPYLLFGPPGTGKTVTLAEMIVQLLKAKPTAKILVCAPSNAATDNIVERLAPSIPPHSANPRLLRVMAYCRRVKDTAASVLPYTTPNGEGGFAPVTLEQVRTAAVVVATIGSSNKLFNLGVVRGHFSLIAVDEAAQASEPEVLSVLGPLALASTAVLLAGDPEQLGPVIKSSVAATKGLDKSLMDRLIRRDLYKASHKTKLLRNYRSHPEILRVPNDLFYDGELIPCAGQSTTHNMVQWTALPAPSCPVIFHGIMGAELQDGDSPSWYNPYEVHFVLQYVKKMRTAAGGFCVAPEDIGVITPYAKQRQKLQQALKKAGYEGIMVGSVEQFQGNERRVIIISTVRSSTAFFADDDKFSLGFVNHPKRFNVAITRAKALLIVVGNPTILETSKVWRSFLLHCARLGAIAGVAPALAMATLRREAQAAAMDKSESDDGSESYESESDDGSALYESDVDDDDDLQVDYRSMYDQVAQSHAALEREEREAQETREREYLARYQEREAARRIEEERLDRQRQEANAEANARRIAALRAEEEEYMLSYARQQADSARAQEEERQMRRNKKAEECTIL